MIRTLVIDDNKLARMGMHQLAMQVKDLEVVGECATALEAYQILQSQPIELLLLDIEMPDMSGIELTKLLGEQRPVIIFTTGKKDYAIEAFELNVADYLLKPVNLTRFLQAIEKTRSIIASQQAPTAPDLPGFIFIRDNGQLKRVGLDDILYLEAMGDYVKVYTTSKFFAIHSTLKHMEEKLSAASFIKVHRSYIVALNRIDSIADGMIHIGKNAVPIADAYKQALHQKLNLL